MLGAVLCVRLQVVDWISRHPEVLDERITAPWVVVGLPRTGTTLLSFLLDLDPENRSLLHWEAASPVPPPALATAAEDPRIAEARGQVDGLHRLNPSLRAMHPMGATLPTECVTLLAQDFRSIHFETQFPAPSYGAWLDGQDLSSSYAHHRRMLQLLQSRIPTAHWSLKTPYHLWQLGTLRETYPDARVIWTHRDPAQVVPSVASLNTAFHRTWCRNPDPVAIGHSWNEKLHTGLSRGMAYDAGRDDPDWCAHLQYTELMKDPVGSVQRLYSHFGCEVSPLHERRMRAWMEQRPQQQFGRHRYDPADFGFSEHGIRVEYAAYLERFDVERETG